MEICDVCGVPGEEVRLFDAIYEGRMSKLCERCSIIENIPLIKTPNPSQLKESETLRVSDRMKQISGFRGPERKETFFKEDKLNELDKNPELELPEKNSLNLVDHFHWEVMKHRRRKGLSERQLAELLGESEVAIQMLEKAKLPQNAEILIKKLEQFYQIKLRNIPEPEIVHEPVLMDEMGKEIEIIPEEEMVFVEDTFEEGELDVQDKDDKPVEIQPIELKGDLDVKKIDKGRVTIGDLQKHHVKRVDVIEKEKIEEQEKMKERLRILADLRERDRLKIEERKRKELLEKEDELARNKLIEEEKREKEKENGVDSFDKYLGGGLSFLIKIGIIEKVIIRKVI